MNVGVLVSGTGTNLQALLDADLGAARVAVVVSNRPGVAALDRATAAGVPAVVVPHGAYGDDRAAFEDALLAVLAQHGVLPGGAVVLAGFMRILTPRFVDRFPLRIVNTHPSLLPAFPGANAVADALAHGVKVTGATVHFVDGTLDGGPIIAQAAVPVLPGDDAAALHARILCEEHRILPAAVRSLAAGELLCQGRHVIRRGSGAE
ncbi:MAG: phosphoribosylglycinamide formyltransferase [Deltaproteobacteria bacterium]|nr:phosphoribosylglycinamide formyltransferase [Deltaproteobacteria bacterium]